MNPYVKQYRDTLQDMMDQVLETQEKPMEQAADLIADAIADRRGIFGFSSMHASMVIIEMVYRAGGLAVINPITSPALLFNHRPITGTSDFERLPGHASILLQNSPIKAGDVLIVHACSGRVAALVEMPMKARQMGVKVIGIYSEQYAGHVTSMDPSRTMMQDHCDVLIDNAGVMGDACVTVKGMKQKVAPSSTVVGAFIANALVLLVCDKLLRRGIEPPVFSSANVDGGREFNDRIMSEYADMIHYM